jgi:hypothetical protein
MNKILIFRGPFESNKRWNFRENWISSFVDTAAIYAAIVPAVIPFEAAIPRSQIYNMGNCYISGYQNVTA